MNELVEGDVLPRAIELARALAEGKTKVKLVEKGPLSDVPEKLPDVELGHLSRAIDNIVVRAILEVEK